MNRISDTAHALLPWVGIILAMQAPITAYLVDTGLPVRVVDLAIGGLALGYTAWSKHTDSTNDAAKATAPIPLLPQNLDLPQQPPAA